VRLGAEELAAFGRRLVTLQTASTGRPLVEWPATTRPRRTVASAGPVALRCLLEALPASVTCEPPARAVGCAAWGWRCRNGVVMKAFGRALLRQLQGRDLITGACCTQAARSLT